MSMTEQDLARTAKLAKLDLSSSNAAMSEQKINNIFTLLSKLDELDVSNITPLTHPLDLQQPLRPDLAATSQPREHIEKAAQHLSNHLYIVPQVLNHDS